MSKVIFGMTMSLDGFINDESGSLGKLYPDFNNEEFKNYINATAKSVGAVMMGRKTFDTAENTNDYADNYEYQVPIFVLTHNPPVKHPKENENLTITFLDKDIKESTAIAKKAAGDKDVTVVGGSNIFQQLINAKLIDELSIDIIPVLIKSGTKLFENITVDVELETIKVDVIGDRICTQYKVISR